MNLLNRVKLVLAYSRVLLILYYIKNLN